jgi:hypothetical protein
VGARAAPEGGFTAEIDTVRLRMISYVLILLAWDEKASIFQFDTLSFSFFGVFSG